MARRSGCVAGDNGVMATGGNMAMLRACGVGGGDVGRGGVKWRHEERLLYIY